MKRILLYIGISLLIAVFGFGLGLSIPNQDSYLRGVRDGRIQAYYHYARIAADQNIYKSLVLTTPNNTVKDCIFVGSNAFEYTEESTNNTVLNSWMIGQ